MMEINGAYANAIVYADEIEASAAGQIQALCDQPFAAGAKIRIMPDVHTGKGCTIGTTMTVGEYVVPNLVGVDIGCGMDVVLLKEKRVNLPALDAFISKNIPHGRDVREKAHRNSGQIDISELECFQYIDTRRAAESIGTLGGGNHFIELDRDEEGNLYLVIHTGSRNLGLQVAEYYQKLAYERVGGRSQTEIPFELAYLTGEDRDRYLHDMAVMQQYAALNRRTIRDCILDGLKLHEAEFFTTVHNYIDLEHGILRKGSVSARAGERLLIPLNMRDGALICVGLGNDDWNQSAPHGAGRLFSRTQAESSFTLSAFRKSMEGIYTSTVSQDTLDECPMAYKDPQTIIAAIGDTVQIEKQSRPIYNFKSSDRFTSKKK
ncbi:MAG: RtcB family protein [Oscillospiraceae bacterium]|nr:RtcB family protein [Oscillospiraceae bacterium]MBQ3704170.1 RtcB family protein [Oscillospiraceae bacterium]